MSAGPSSPPPRLRVAVIGCGRIGAVLGAALARAGHHLVGTCAVSELSRLRAAALLPHVPILDAPTAVERADLVLLTVPDRVLPDLVRGLGATGHVRPGQFWCHTSGSQGLDVLEPAILADAVPLALHPVMTFTGTSIDLDRLADCPFGVTAPPEFRPVAEALVLEIGGDPVWIPADARVLYHAALTLGSNGLMALIAASVSTLDDAGIDAPRRLLEPLLTASLDNALRLGDGAMTGPVVRGDADTVRAHIRALEEVSMPTVQAYRAMAQLIVARALAAGTLDAAMAREVLEALGDDGGVR
jgi:predicted short-subunit dehydrogenase-like oxidoreductase (DUF2520 family)